MFQKDFLFGESSFELLRKSMKKYVFRIYQGNDFEDGDSIWQTARSWDEAESIVRSEYHSINRLDRLYEK